MKIVSITTTRESIPLKNPFKTALRTVYDAEFIRAKIVFEDGSESFGEAPATKAITGEDLESIEQNIAEVTPLLLGLGSSEALQALHASSIGSSSKAALDMALFIQEAIGNTKPIETDITISLGTKEEMLQEAQNAKEQGIKLFKVKLGSDIAHAIEVTHTLADQFDEVQLLIDANQAWSVAQSLEYIEGVKDLSSIALIEQPVTAKDLKGLKTVSQNSPIPILADEAVFSFEDAKHIHQNNIAQMINIKLMKCGGVSQAIKILEYAREHNITCMLGSMIEGPISINAAVQLAFNYRDVIRFVDLDSPLLYKEPSKLLSFRFDRGEVFVL
ncbi:dipeptide epimerase [Sulfurimonas sp. C5]|uniref:dipeptide epimerase n=1 Tax=Sulfurimonas sp. C5 TaxID=3036947 RepID=UPI0024562307|nr:dipeptide epimerase [Sulfurimonas sp. C5]MDH4945251.1 dipeptide epimerase [Sulfurimonas sp. C5]